MKAPKYHFLSQFSYLLRAQDFLKSVHLYNLSRYHLVVQGRATDSFFYWQDSIKRNTAIPLK